jgi:hypothetical protein
MPISMDIEDTRSANTRDVVRHASKRALHAHMLPPSQGRTRIVPCPLRNPNYTVFFYLHPPPSSPFQPTSRLRRRRRRRRCRSRTRTDDGPLRPNYPHACPPLCPHAHPPHIVLLQNDAVATPSLRALPHALPRDRQRRQCCDRA